MYRAALGMLRELEWAFCIDHDGKMLSKGLAFIALLGSLNKYILSHIMSSKILNSNILSTLQTNH